MSDQNSNIDNESLSGDAVNLAGQLLMQDCGNHDDRNFAAGSHPDDERGSEELIHNIKARDQELINCSFDFDEEIKNSLVDIEQSDELGPAVGPLLAEAYKKTILRPLSKENKEKLKNGLKIPENCAEFRVPKMNAEIWHRLPQRAKMVDLNHQQLQQTLSLGMTVLVKMCDELSRAASQMPKETLTRVLKIGLDGANLMGNQMQDLNQKRKADIKPFLNTDISDICNTKVR
ncbi:unnamed protein product [Orchesella dallaii]|uniref:Uncharacterized protein n=1 Tax=Orchesella dallaii TaxID=48710 RepID=A0ABP1PMZ9_9HEXA